MLAAIDAKKPKFHKSKCNYTKNVIKNSIDFYRLAWYYYIKFQTTLTFTSRTIVEKYSGQQVLKHEFCQCSNLSFSLVYLT